MRRNGEGEVIGCPCPVASVGTDGHVEACQIVGIGKGYGSDLTSVQLGNV